MVAWAIGLACNTVLDHSLDSVVYSWKPNLFTKKLFRLYQTLVTLMCNRYCFVAKGCRYNYTAVPKNDVGFMIDDQLMSNLFEPIQFWMISILKLLGKLFNVPP